MRGSTFELKSKATRGPQARHWLLAALCAGGALLSAVSHADDRRRGGDDWQHRGQYSQQQRGHDSRHDRRHDDRRDLRRDRDRRSHDWDSRSDRRSFGRSDFDRHQFNRPHNRQWDRRDSGRYFRPDWHYYSGRYWAPARYRGRYCDDRRHFHGAHYHVAARDYYDYYYPRYSYSGPRPYGANASVIISLPLF